MTSRYMLPDPPGSPSNAITTTGWDPRFATFWAQSYVGDERCVFRYGITPREIPTLEELAELLRTHDIHLPPEIARQLARDMWNVGSR